MENFAHVSSSHRNEHTRRWPTFIVAACKTVLMPCYFNILQIVKLMG